MLLLLFVVDEMISIFGETIIFQQIHDDETTNDEDVVIVPLNKKRKTMKHNQPIVQNPLAAASSPTS